MLAGAGKRFECRTRLHRLFQDCKGRGQGRFRCGHLFLHGFILTASQGKPALGIGERPS